MSELATSHYILNSAISVAIAPNVLPPTSPEVIEQVRELEALSLSTPQVDVTTHHVLHGGVYTRAICIPKGVVLTSALIKIPTTLVVCGEVSVMVGDGEAFVVQGYRVLAASAGRKLAYIAHEDTFITMSFKTDARTVEEAEAEFTDEHEKLISRRGLNHVVITGE